MNEDFSTVSERNGSAAIERQFMAAVRQMLRESHTAKPSELSIIVRKALAPLGVEPTIYVADYEQRTLRALPGDPAAESPVVAVDGSVPGLAFQTVSIQESQERLWVPILDGTVRLGVLLATMPQNLSGKDSAVRDGCLAVASLVGHLLQAKRSLGDTIEGVRRTQSMTAASELVWQLVPPPTFVCDRLAIAAVLEPSYDIGGDGFDYGVDGHRATVVLLDALGHGMPAALTCSLALSALRAARRDGQPLVQRASTADEAITQQWNDARFATAVCADIDLNSGHMRYINAGHPPPVLLRAGKAVKLLDGGRRLPLGLLGEPPAVVEERLQPGDRILLYTDGVTEARAPDDSLFGLSRLIDLAERHVASDLPTPEIMRRLSHAVLDHQEGVLQDDATLLLVEWTTDALYRDLP